MAVQPFKRDSSQPASAPPPNVAEAPAKMPEPASDPASDPAPANDAPAARKPVPQGQGLVAKFKSDPRKYILSGAGLLLALFVGYQGIHWLSAGRYAISKHSLMNTMKPQASIRDASNTSDVKSCHCPMCLGSVKTRPSQATKTVIWRNSMPTFVS